MSDLTHTITVDATPQEAFDAIVDVRSWWGATNIVGPTDQLGADWFYLVPDIHYSKQRTAELVPGERVVWEFTDGHLDFIAEKDEWVGTTARFDIAAEGGQTTRDLHPRGPRVDRRVLRGLPRRLAALHHHQPASADPDRPGDDADQPAGRGGGAAARPPSRLGTSAPTDDDGSDLREQVRADRSG